MLKRQIRTNTAPQPAGGYSQALVVGDLAFVSGQIGADPETGEIPGSLEAQTEQVLKNVISVVKAAGHVSGDLVKLTVYLSDFKLFERYDTIYATYFSDSRPARTTVACDLGEDVLIEVDAISCRSASAVGSAAS